MPSQRSLVLSAVLVGCCGTTALAELFVPDDLNPGDQYHFAFFTGFASGSLTLPDATSDDISVYNNYVNSAAEAAGSTTAGSDVVWRAITSTPTVDARDNASVSGAVYLLDGTQLADGFSDFWDGTLNAPLNINQFGVTEPNALVSTGSDSAGFGATNAELGSSSGNSAVGVKDVAAAVGITGATWINVFERPQASAFGFFALSQPLTVASVPEPSSTWLMLCAVAIAGVVHVRKLRRHPSLR